MPPADADEVRQGADEILSRPEFQEPPRSLYQRGLDWIGDRIGDLVGALVSGGAGGVVAWVLLVAVVGLLAFLLLRAVQRDRRRPATGAGPTVAVDADERRPAAAWLEEAARFEAAGRWRDGLRCRYRALVATLSGRGVLEEVPGRTAGEYRSLVRRSRPAVAEPFAGATDLFERAWYGSYGAGPEDAAAFARLADEVLTGGSP